MWREAGHKLVGCDMLQHCTVPFGSGLSSSAAIEVSTIAALAVAAGEEFDPVEVAQLAQRAEREFAGVNCALWISTRPPAASAAAPCCSTARRWNASTCPSIWETARSSS